MSTEDIWYKEPAPEYLGRCVADPPVEFITRALAEDQLGMKLTWNFEPAAKYSGIRSTFNHADRWAGKKRDFVQAYVDDATEKVVIEQLTTKGETSATTN